MQCRIWRSTALSNSLIPKIKNIIMEMYKKFTLVKVRDAIAVKGQKRIGDTTVYFTVVKTWAYDSQLIIHESLEIKLK